MTISKTPLWTPSAEHETNVVKFMKYVNQKRGLKLQNYQELYEWSVDETTLSTFWEDTYMWLELSPDISNIGRALNMQKDHERGMLFPPPKFFPSCRLNISEIILRNKKDDDLAIQYVRESVSDIYTTTWGDLRKDIREIRDAMLSAGVGQGDVIAAVISNSVRAISICLATLSIGAVWSSSSPDMGPEAIIDRYAQVRPKFIFADDGYVYGGKLIELQSRISKWSKAISEQVPTLQNVVIIPSCRLQVEWSEIQTGCSFEAFLNNALGRPLEFCLLPFSHPGFILFSSGTTGKPKCILHSIGGVALKTRTDSILQHDTRQDDVVFQYTTTSWVMWILNLLNLGVGRSLLLYDGSPFYPTSTVLLQLAQNVGVTVFGTSPRYLSEIRSRHIVPREQFGLDKLRVLTSTGAVLSAELYEWFYGKAFPPHAHLISMSGGTDIAGSFVGGTPIQAVYAGEIQVKALGMAVGVLDAVQTEPLSVELSGAVGELVCTKPFPSQPLSFLGETGVEKYQISYFSRYGPRVWCQGDLVQIYKETGGIVMLGRSDGVLNPSGVRFGSAEIYAVTETFPEIQDSICVGQQREEDANERVLLFVMLKEGLNLTDDLEGRLKDAIRRRNSSRHVPSYIFQVADIPYTVNGKKCELAVKHVVCGREMAVSGTVGNPEALNLYTRFRDLSSDAKTSSGRNSKL